MHSVRVSERRRRKNKSNTVNYSRPATVPMASGLVVLLAYIVLPFASPYAGVGTLAGNIPPVQRPHAVTLPTSNAAAASALASGRTNTRLQLLKQSNDGKSSSNLPQLEELNSNRDMPTATRLQSILNRCRTKLRMNASVTTNAPTATIAAPTPEMKRKWQYGEYNATIPSRLVYGYASSLLDAASVRQLESTDAFAVPDHRKMNRVVPDLATIHEKCRSKARKRLAALQSSSIREEGGGGDSTSKNRDLKKRTNDRIAQSESLILAKALILQQKKTLLLTGILRLLNTTIQAFPALLVSRLLRLIESGDTYHPSKPLGAALTLIAVLSVKMIVENQYFHIVVKCATLVRGSLAGIIFDKSLRVSSNAGGNIAVEAKEGGSEESRGKDISAKEVTNALGAGGVLNLMQSDASVLENAAMQIHTLWDGLLQITIYTTLLFRYLGPSVLWGISVLLLTIPTNSITLRVLNRLNKRENEAKDARTRRTAEAIFNMKLLKLQSWENSFADDIQIERNEELRRHIAKGAFRALNQAISNAIPAIVLVVTLTAYKRTGRPVVASTVFTAISLLNQLRFPLFFYPMLIDSLANGKNALKRISSYLSQEEITPYVQRVPKIDGEGGGIELRNGNFLWSPQQFPANENNDGVSVSPALCGAELAVKPGEVVAVVGPVGSGKTALVKALLGELAPVPRMVVDQSLQSISSAASNSPAIMDIPTVTCRGSIAYCAQEAWLPKGTIRDAVVFGREYNERQYLSALCDAGLDSDIVNDNAVDAEEAALKGMLSHDTDVGEGGSSLSGGQRARVALARALYDENAGAYLLDDPLSALDASVGSKVFERVTRRLRQRKAATIFVTNDPSLPRRCDRVILMGKPEQLSSRSQPCSRIVDMGTYDQLLARGHDLKSLATIPHSPDDESTWIPTPGMETHINSTIIIAANRHLTATRGLEYYSGGDEAIATCHADPDRQISLEHDPEYYAEKAVPVTPEIETEFEEGDTCRLFIKPPDNTGPEIVRHDLPTAASLKDPVKKLKSADDLMSTGAVPRSTYITYFRSVRKPLLIVVALLSFLMANGAQFFQQYVVAKWTEVSSADAMASALGGRYLRLLVYAAGVVSVFLWLRSYLLMRVGVRASEFLHNRLLSSVFRAPISFFDATPSGQLLSRFGKEMETVDRSVPDGIGSVLFCFLQIFLSTAALAGVVTPAMLIPLGVIGVLYVSTMGRFRPAARDMKRCESKSRAPIYTHFGEALRGSETIRSITNGRATWSDQHRRLSDDNLAVFYSVKALDRWLSVRLETLGNVVVLAAAVASVFLTRSGKLKSGSAGWGLTQALSITGLMTWAVRVLTDLETQMMSVLRVTELTDLESSKLKGTFPDSSEGSLSRRIPYEKARVGEAIELVHSSNTIFKPATTPLTDNALMASGWPWLGGIKFKNVSMRYNAISPPVLNNVTLSVPPGTTLGIVGRTGSGKSSLLLTLFRLIEIEEGGSIEIDDVDVRSVSIQNLRKSLSIIPQDPILFAGTVMYNLDATEKSSREDAWIALEAASPDLARQFRLAGTGLDTLITEGGKNLSLGQRQLICLARALLRKSKILVMDEATSSVDSQTDAQVQKTIRREFVNKGVTVMTVAHRLDTVLGSDKIAVLGAGELVEYGTPSELLKNRNGELRRLVDVDNRNKRKGAKAKTEETMVTV